ncbi:MAG: hypothetical protein N3B01_07695, partial [Verrucomicrobiae bacterium]|nr:hypothetical protein [Verrucomicrobiae bacterium]
LYINWIAAVVVGAALLRKLTSDKTLWLGSGILAIALSLPAFSLHHAYNYQATALAGLTIYLLLAWHESQRLRYVFLAGVAAGICLYAKQNVGLVMALGGLVATTVLSSSIAMGFRFRRVLRDAAWFIAGWCLSVVPVFVYFAHWAGAAEVCRQMLFDGGQLKRDLLVALSRHVVKAVSSGAPTSERLLLGALILLGVTACVAAMFIPANRGFPPRRQNLPLFQLTVVGFCAVSGLLCLLSFADCEAVRELAKFQLSALAPSLTSVARGTVYFGILGLTLACLLRRPLQNQTSSWVLCFFLVIFTAAYQMSARPYICFAAPLSVPLVVAIAERWRLLPNSLPALTVLAAALVTVASFLNSQHGMFVRLMRLPDRSSFARLYSYDGFPHQVAELVEQLSPRIRNAPTLWLCAPGPHLAYGGKPVFNVASFWKDTYHSRVEPTLFTRWEADPPDFVVFGPFERAPNARLLTEEHIQRWLNERYTKIWTSRTTRLTLWQRKSHPRRR